MGWWKHVVIPWHQAQSFLADSEQFALLVAALGHAPWSLKQAGAKKS